MLIVFTFLTSETATNLWNPLLCSSFLNYVYRIEEEEEDEEEEEEKEEDCNA